MKKLFWSLICVLCVTSSAFALPGDYEQLILTRTFTCSVEGQSLGDLVLGARGKITFVYVDAALKKALKKEGDNAPSWLKEQANYVVPYPKKIGFAIMVEAYKPWDFDRHLLHIGGNFLTADTFLPKENLLPGGSLESGFSGAMSVSVPSQWAVRGKSLQLGYGEDSVVITLPKR